ncbi:unnamed protein product [Durusdinium trenchii]|uniref:Uncharacterized protein n=1 Tax=Durusdinium trenchii TaxID=1381693 RepID=A0ABP0KNM8_9DINO
MLPDRSSLLTYALCGAERGPHVNLVTVILDRKADPNRADLRGRYPLLCAVKTGSVELVKAEAVELVAHGADVYASGFTLASLAEQGGNLDMLEAIDFTRMD